MPVERKDDPFVNSPLSKEQAQQQTAMREQTNVILQVMVNILMSFFDNDAENRDILESASVAKQYTTSENPRAGQKQIHIHTSRHIDIAGEMRAMPEIIIETGSYKPIKYLGSAYAQPHGMIRDGMVMKYFTADIDVRWKVSTHSEQTTNNLSFLLAQILTMHIPYRYKSQIINNEAGWQIIFPNDFGPAGDQEKEMERDAVRDRLYTYTYAFTVRMESLIYLPVKREVRDIVATRTVPDPEIFVPDNILLGDTVDVAIKALGGSPSLFSDNRRVFKLTKLSSNAYIGRAVAMGTAKLILTDGDRRVEKEVTVGL